MCCRCEQNDISFDTIPTIITTIIITTTTTNNNNNNITHTTSTTTITTTTTTTGKALVEIDQLERELAACAQRKKKEEQNKPESVKIRTALMSFTTDSMRDLYTGMYYC